MATPTALPATFVASTVLPAADLNLLRGAFRVLQVVQGTYATIVSNSTTTMADTGLSASITPQYSSSKVLVLVSQTFNKTTGNANNAVAAQLVRTTTVINSFAVATGYTGTALDGIFGISCTHLDSPATTSATTYKTRVANFSASAAVGANPNSTTATITLIEISA